MNKQFKSCFHNQKNSCTICGKKNDGKCTLQPVLADASVILSKYLEESRTLEAKDFINTNRHLHRIIVNGLILGEVLKVIVEEHSRLKEEINNIMLDLQSFEYEEINFNNEEFRKLLDVIITAELRCGERDRVHIAVAAYQGIPFASFDGGINDGDVPVINKAIEETGKKFRLYNFKK